MRKTRWLIIILAFAACFGAGVIFAQTTGRGRGTGRTGGSRGNTTFNGRGSSGIDMGGGFSNRGYSSRSSLPDWEPNKEFPNDVFTFARVRYSSTGGTQPDRNATHSKWFNDPPIIGDMSLYRWNSGTFWNIDYPDSDKNFIFRLHQLTSIEVNPENVNIELTNPELYNYPFLYMCAPGYLELRDAEVKALRNYLLNGGFMWMDDFWGDNEWENVYDQMKRVFPEPIYEPKELTLQHPIFNCVFVLKKKPQILNYQWAEKGRPYGITWERPDARLPHYMAINDSKGRMMVLMSLNTDTGDGWEREGDNEWFFHTFSESQAYPLGINVVFYVMTH